MKPRFIFHVTSTVAISIVQQVLGLVRHILIAAFFGVSGEFDAYLVVYAVSSIVVFNLLNVFDTVAVPRLVQIFNESGVEAFWHSSNRLLLQCIAGGLLLGVAFVAICWILLPAVAAGFSEAERARVLDIAWYFIPWVAVVIPYYALSSHLKAQWLFHWVFGAEVVIIVVSIGVLWLWHDAVIALPLAYFCGYLVAAILLLWRRGIRRSKPATPAPGLLHGMANLHLANQIGIAGGLIDRFFQSFLMTGGISSLGYVSQIVNNLSSLLTFRDIYVVPLAADSGRDEKVERVLKGVLLASIPAAGFLVVFAEPTIAVLFQRGQFTKEAAEMTASVLRILAIALAISSILAPMARLFQIMNRTVYTHVMYAASLAGTVILQSVFIFRLGWDVQGFAIASVINSALVTLLVAFLIGRCGVRVAWHRVIAYGAYAFAAAALASTLAAFSAAPFGGLWALLVAAPVYATVVAGAYLLIATRIRAIAGMP